MKRGAIIGVLLGLSGVAAGVLLVPGGLELAEMQFRDENHREALAAFERRWESGDHSREVAVRLSDLYLRLSALDKASGILETFLADNGYDLEMRLRLAQIFVDSQRIKEAIATLMGIAREDADADILRRLAGLQNFAGMSAARGETLALLCETGAATFDEHVEAARQLAQTGAHKRALTILYNAATRFPDALTLPFVQFFMALSADAGRIDLGLALGRFWWERHRDGAAFEIVLLQLVRLGQIDAALAFSRAIAPLAPSDARTQVAAAGFEALFGDSGLAMQMLRTLRDTKRLSLEGAVLLIDLAMRRGLMDEAFAVAEEASFPVLPRWLKGGLASLAQSASRSDFARAVLAQYPDGGGVGEPALQGRLLLAAGDRTGAGRKAQESARLDDPEPAERLDLVQLYTDLGERDKATRALAPLKDLVATMAADELPPLIVAAARLDKTELALMAAERFAQLRPGSAANVLLARAYAVAGHGQKALDLLVGMDLTRDDVEEAYIAALRALDERAALQEHLYRRLLQSPLTEERRLSLLYALNDSGPPFTRGISDVAARIEGELRDELSPAGRSIRLSLLGVIDPSRALPWLEAAAREDPLRDGPAYVDALRKLNRQEALVAYIASVLPNLPDGPVADGFLYVLIELKAYAAALPGLEVRARARGGDWDSAFLDALKQTGNHDRLIAYARDMAQSPGVTAERQRNLAFILLEAGAREDAEAIFIVLAEASGPLSPDAQQLLFLFGPRPSADRIAYLLRQAEGASGPARAQWLRHVVNAGAPGDALRIARTMMGENYDRDFAMVMMSAMAALKDRSLMAALTRLILAHETDGKALLAMARDAEATPAPAEAFALFSAAGEKGEVAAYEGAAAAAIVLARPRDALAMLDAFARAGGKSFTADYLSAESLYALNRKADARAWYERALVGAKAAPATSKPALRIIALCLIRLGNISEARSAIDKVLAAHPGDRGIRAEIGSALIDAGALDLAAQILEGQG